VAYPHGTERAFSSSSGTGTSGRWTEQQVLKDMPCDVLNFSLLNVISRIALYRASVSAICDGTCRSVCLSVGLSVHKVYCGKTAEWIWMPFGLVSGVDRGMEVVIVEGKGQF